MRLYIEAWMGFARIVKIDREEAIHNIDRAFEAKLEALHSLSDASKTLFPWFDHGDTALLLAVRNAIHHRDHPLFHSLLTRVFLDKGPERWAGASFLVATHPTKHGAPIWMSHYIRIDDIDARLNPAAGSPYRDALLKAARAETRRVLIDRDLGLDLVREEAARGRFPADHVYLDLMPVFISAVRRVFTAMKASGVAFVGFDANAYLGPFTSEIEVDLKYPGLKIRRID